MQIETIITLTCENESIDYLKLSTYLEDQDSICVEVHQYDAGIGMVVIPIAELQQAISYFKLQKKAETFLEDCQEITNG